MFVKLKDWDLRNRPGLRGQGRSPAGPCGRSRASAAPSSSPSRRPPSPSSASPPASTSCSRTGAASATRSSPRRRTSSSGWPPRTRASPGCGPTAWPTCRCTRWTSTGRRPARSACPSARSRATSRPRSAAPTSATSSRAGGSSASTPRPTPRSGCSPSDLDRLHVRNRQGGLVPLSAVASGRWVYGSPRLERYNGFPAMNIQGEAAPGHRTGEAMKAMEELIGQAPPGHRLRVDRPLLPAAHVRVPDRAALRLLDPRDLPRPGGALRELDVPHLRPAGPAARRHRRRPGLHAARHAQRRLLPDRPAHRARPDDQERHPDRPVRHEPHGAGAWA